MAPVQQLGEVSWLEVCAAYCHMALLLCIYIPFLNFLLLLSIPSLYFFQIWY